MTLKTITSNIRGGGAIGSRAWVARITGPDPKWGVAREFCRKSRHTSASGRSGYVDFYCDEPGVYELRGIGDFMGGSIARQAGSGGGWSGFIRVHDDGSYDVLGERELSPADVLALLDGKQEG